MHKARFRTEKAPVISPSAFEPRVKGHDPDTDGISFYRAACLGSPVEILAAVAPDKRQEIGIVRVEAKTLRALGLAVEPRPDARVKGHVIIPALNAADYAADKSRWTPVLLAISTSASRDENIVLRPGDLE